MFSLRISVDGLWIEKRIVERMLVRTIWFFGMDNEISWLSCHEGYFKSEIYNSTDYGSPKSLAVATPGRNMHRGNRTLRVFTQAV